MFQGRKDGLGKGMMVSECNWGESEEGKRGENIVELEIPDEGETAED